MVRDHPPKRALVQSVQTAGSAAPPRPVTRAPPLPGHRCGVLSRGAFRDRGSPHLVTARRTGVSEKDRAVSPEAFGRVKGTVRLAEHLLKVEFR